MQNNFLIFKIFFSHRHMSLWLTILIIFFSACNKPTPPPDVPPYIHPITLTNEDVSCTDVFVRIKTTKVFESLPAGQAGGTIQLKRDGATILSLSSSLFAPGLPIDTLVMDEGLLPKREYRYKTYRIDGGLAVDSSMELTVRTMDTTSHEFNWDITYLGDGASSVLRDVCIINDTCVWAVGEIYKKDSTGQFETDAYNAAVWNGKVWELKRIQFYTFCGPGSLTGPYPANAVFAFDDGEIWISSQSQVAKWKNGVQISITCLPVSINKIWGSSKNNVYTAGPLGQIGFYNGVSWRRLESGTTVSINDIWGAVDEKTGKKLILCAASNILELGEHKILSIKENNTVDTLPWSMGRRVHSVWFKNQFRIVTAGGGVFIGSVYDDWKEVTELPLYFTDRVRGKNINDIFVVGDFGFVSHFNGFHWRFYPELAAALYYSCDYKRNMLIAVGERNARAVILRMWRQ